MQIITGAQLAWSGSATALALLGLTIAFRPKGSLTFRCATATAFALLAGLAGAPLLRHGLGPIWTFYLPAMLVFWAILPVALSTAATAFVDSSAKFRIGWSGLPAVMALALAMVTWMLPQSLREALLIDGEIPNGSRIGAVVAITAFALVLITALVWLAEIARMFAKLRGYHRQLRDLYSNADQFEVRWLGPAFALPGAFAFAVALLVLNDNLLGLPAPGQAAILAGCASVIFLLVAWVSYATPPAQIEQPDPAPKYARSPLTDEQAERIGIRLDQAMSLDLAFLDPLLSLQSLAGRIAVPANQLSRYLNERSELSFFDYINRLRARHASELLLNNKSSVLDAAFASGFNSKSTFYKAFRREFGQSPAAYLQGRPRLDGGQPDRQVSISRSNMPDDATLDAKLNKGSLLGSVG